VLVAAAVSEVGPRTRELGGELRIEVEPDLPDVFVDEAQLIQVLVILLNNALDATGSPRRVLLRVVEGPAVTDAPDWKRDAIPPGARPTIRFEVRDDGPGVPAEILERIFDPFFTTKASGTGLGLSIAQHIVSENGGSIEVISPRVGPTTFAVTVPGS
jgi:signal transduction histidine kinase